MKSNVINCCSCSSDYHIICQKIVFCDSSNARFGFCWTDVLIFVPLQLTRWWVFWNFYLLIPILKNSNVFVCFWSRLKLKARVRNFFFWHTRVSALFLATWVFLLFMFIKVHFLEVCAIIKMKMQYLAHFPLFFGL